jgi:magnesium-transporting ATPase (P-type)
MGTDVCGGKGLGVVVRTGMETEIGHLMSLLKHNDKEATPLQEKVTSISKKFVKGALVAGALVFVTGLLRGVPITQMISTSTTLAASAIPEGLPVTITIALSAGIFRLAKKNALIRKLSSLETLGRTTIICTDKTGTLTKNEMTVKALSTVDRSWTVTGNGYEPTGFLKELSPEVAVSSAALSEVDDRGDSSSNPDLERLLQICVLCNNSMLEQLDGQWITKGDPTEGALLTLAAKNGMWLKDMSHWHRGKEVPFDSNTARMSVVCKDEQSERECYVFSKGAVESILRHCSRYQKNGEIFLLTEEQKMSILQQNEQLSGEALRVLAFAYRPVEENVDDEGIDEKELIYIGMAGMMDPAKPDVENSIREAFALDVKPVMITGDHPITAIAIAKQLGIYDGSQQVLSGHELNRLSDDELDGIVDLVSIFARVTPEHKLRIVRAFQKRGHIVAMTGDGVNDTPAIKQANVGIAMGRTGTEVTKETADMVLTEDHFGTIVDGVKEGRTIIGNIRKAIGCLLTGNLAEIIVTSAAVIAGFPIPLVPIQILLMNLLTDALPAMVLAVNPGNKAKQTKRTDIVDKELYQKVVTRGVLLGLGSLGLFVGSLATGAPLPVAQSIAFATLVAGQLIQTFSWRQEGSEETVRDWAKDRFLLGALGISWMALLAVLYVPPLAGFFHTTPLTLRHWLPIVGVAGSISILSKPVLSIISKKQTGVLQQINKYAAV